MESNLIDKSFFFFICPSTALIKEKEERREIKFFSTQMNSNFQSYLLASPSSLPTIYKNVLDLQVCSSTLIIQFICKNEKENRSSHFFSSIFYISVVALFYLIVDHPVWPSCLLVDSVYEWESYDCLNKSYFVQCTRGDQ